MSGHEDRLKTTGYCCATEPGAPEAFCGSPLPCPLHNTHDDEEFAATVDVLVGTFEAMTPRQRQVSRALVDVFGAAMKKKQERIDELTEAVAAAKIVVGHLPSVFTPIEVAIALSLYGFNVTSHERARKLDDQFKGDCADVDEMARAVNGGSAATELPYPTAKVYVQHALHRYGQEARRRVRANEELRL